jgi:hypothetical protein
MHDNTIGPTWSEVKAAYWRNYQSIHLQSQSRQSLDVEDPDFWAWEYVDALWRYGDRAVLELLVDLAESAPDDGALGYLGAGPVEDLVRLFGEERIDGIEAAARQSPSFKRALRGMYGTLVPESIRARMLPLVPTSAAENKLRQQEGKDPL